MVEQLEKNATSFLQEEHSSNSPTGQKADIGNINVPILFANTIGDFHAVIEELKNQSLIISQRLEAQMIKQAMVE